MEELLSKIIKIYINLNEQFDEQLVDKRDLSDMEESIQLFLKDKYNQLVQGGMIMEKISMKKINSPNDEDYLSGMTKIYIGLMDMEEYFRELREIYVSISKKLRYLSGDITLEEYESDGILEIEYVDNIDEED